MKTAIIIGADGQDGRIAFDLLQQKQYMVLGIGRGTVRTGGIDWHEPVDISRQKDVIDLCQRVKVDEIYYFAACHQASEESYQDEVAWYKECQAINVEGLLYFCEGIKKYNPQARLFYAASSLIFEGTDSVMQDEQTNFSAQSIYGMSKLNGFLLGRYYRQQYGLFVANGILYNHESAFREDNFVSTKIIKAAINIKRGLQDSLALCDLKAYVDWGYAPDYVEAIHRILNVSVADDFIIATGVKHSIEDFVSIAFGYLGLDSKLYLRDEKNVQVTKRRILVGDAQKLIKATGWQPTVDFKEMIKLLIKAHGGTVDGG